MDFESEQEVLFSEPIFVNDFTILTVYKGVAYKSRCVKFVMINNSTTIKNAIDIEDSSTFSVPIEIEPTAFKKILQKLHTPKYLWHNISMGDDKNVQHMLIICNWFGITQLYAEIIKIYENLLSPTDWKKYTPKMFENVDDELYRFIDLEPPTKLVPISEPCVVPSVNPVVPANPFGSLSRFGCSYLEHNPIKSLFTGDKLCYELFVQTRDYDHPDRDLKKRKPLSRGTRRVRCKIFECLECGYETKTIAGHPICEKCDNINTFDIEKKR